MASFTVNGDRVFYEVKGEVKGEVTGQGPTLIFLHGLGADRRQAMATTQSLQGCRLICVDMPGHGDSECSTNEAYSFSRYADVALALLDKLEIGSAVWGGISMGSGIALHAALRCPERVDGLLLVRPAWLDKPGLPNLAIVSQVGEWIAELGLDHAREKLMAHSSYRQAQTLSQQCADSIAGLFSRPQAESAAEILSALVQDSPFQHIKQLAQLAIPAIVFGNRDDPLHPELIAKRLADALPAANYINLPARYTQAQHHAMQLTGLMQVFLTDLAKKTATDTLIETHHDY